MKHEDNQLTYKEILSAYRKGDEELYPNAFSEAFLALETDPALAAWFEEDQAFDQEFRTLINDSAVPEQKPVEARPSSMIRFNFIKLAAAALIIFALGLFSFAQYNRVQDQKSAALVADLRENVAAFAASQFELDAMNNDLNVLRKTNVSNGGIHGYGLEKIFANGLPMGCKVIDWKGRKVSLYCFGNDQGQVVHAFAIPIGELNGDRAARHLKAIVEFSERDTGGLIIDDTAYLLVSSMPGVDIKPFLLPAQEAFPVAARINQDLPAHALAMTQP